MNLFTCNCLTFFIHVHLDYVPKIPSHADLELIFDKEVCNRGVACSLLCWQATPSITKFLNFWPIWALFEWFGLLSLGQPLQIILFNLIFFLPLGHVHLWSDEQARLCPKDAESCRSRIDFRHFLPGCSALFVQDFPRYLDAYQPVYGYCCTAFNQGHTDIFVIWRLFLRDTWRRKKSSKQNKQKR